MKTTRIVLVVSGTAISLCAAALLACFAPVAKTVAHFQHFVRVADDNDGTELQDPEQQEQQAEQQQCQQQGCG